MTGATPRPIRFVVVSSPKSGSTWVQSMLSAHKDIHCGESRLFGDYFDPSNPTGPHITLERTVRHLLPHLAVSTDEMFARALLFDMVDAVANRCANETGVQIYGEKMTPYPGTAEGALVRLSEYDSSVRLVHLVRDGRDVVVSGAAHRLNIARQRWANGVAGSGQEDLEAAQQLDDRVIPDRLFELFTRNWVDTNSAMLRCASLFESVLTIRYEDLLDDTEHWARRLFGFITEGTDVPATPGQVRACVEAASFERLSGGRKLGEEDRESFFRKGQAGDWENWFTVEQLRRFDDAGGELLERFGYDRGIAEHAA